MTSFFTDERGLVYCVISHTKFRVVVLKKIFS